MEIGTTTQPAGTQSAASALASDSDKPEISSDFETFLRMLTAQLENQDPLDPVKSEDFAVQLATFSGVEQQVRTNDLLETLGAQMALSGMAQFAGWVGMEARAPVEGYFDGAPISLSPKPQLNADKAELVVTNAFGTEVQRVPIDVSHESVEWSGLLDSGTAPTGLYSFTVDSYTGGVVSDSSPVEVYGKIVEARNDGATTSIVLAGGVEVPATSITSLRDPSTAE